MALVLHLENAYFRKTLPFHVRIEFFYEIIFLGISKTLPRKERERKKTYFKTSLVFLRGFRLFVIPRGLFTLDHSGIFLQKKFRAIIKTLLDKNLHIFTGHIWTFQTNSANNSGGSFFTNFWCNEQAERMKERLFHLTPSYPLYRISLFCLLCAVFFAFENKQNTFKHSQITVNLLDKM